MHLHEEEVYQMHSHSIEELKTIEGERLEFKSVGIDIGSSTSHLMFSRLVLARRGKEYYSGYTVVEREIVYRSPIIFTPFVLNNSRIDTAKLSEFIRESYDRAHLCPSQIDTGAVITTGEAAKKENTAAIIDLIAEDAGKFVCAAAGPGLEAVLSAYGSGAVKQSQSGSLKGRIILNVDVGGGTSKLALIRDGVVLQTCAVNVGSRLVAWEKNGILTRMEASLKPIAETLGLKVEIGQKLSINQIKKISQKLAEILFEVIRQEDLSSMARSLMLTPGLCYSEPVASVYYSGGVAEFIYGREKENLGDLGLCLGQAIRDTHRCWGVELGRPQEMICATVIGASQYTVQVSGNTIFLSEPSILPLRNLPVIKIAALMDDFDQADVIDSVKRGFQALGLVEGKQAVAMAVTWRHDPDYLRLFKFAEGVKLALAETIAAKLPLVLIFDQDVGRLVGHLLDELEVSHVISVDNIDIGELSYIDIGQILLTTNAVPVTVKSLIFR